MKYPQNVDDNDLAGRFSSVQTLIINQNYRIILPCAHFPSIWTFLYQHRPARALSESQSQLDISSSL